MYGAVHWSMGIYRWSHIQQRLILPCLAANNCQQFLIHSKVWIPASTFSLLLAYLSININKAFLYKCALSVEHIVFSTFLHIPVSYNFVSLPQFYFCVHVIYKHVYISVCVHEYMCVYDFMHQ